MALFGLTRAVISPALAHALPGVKLGIAREARPNTALYTKATAGDGDVKRVYSAQNTLMVDHFKHVLDTQGIACAVRNRMLSSAAGNLPVPECWTELWILDDADWTEAQAIVVRALAEDDRTSGETWECPRCGERIEAQFEACWKCPTSPEVSTDEGPVVEEPILGVSVLSQPLSPNAPLWLVFVLLALGAWYILRSYAGLPF